MQIKNNFTFKWHSSILEIDQNAWSELIQKDTAPVLEYEWLKALEQANCVGPACDWKPQFLSCWNNQELIAVAPFYEKTSSEGEFIADYIWAELARGMEIPYFPKLLGMVPFTPISSYRFLIKPEYEAILTPALITEAIDRAKSKGYKSLNFVFVENNWLKGNRLTGFLSWEHPVFLWENQGYRDWADFLKAFKKNQRRNIKREEESIAQKGIELKFFKAEEIPWQWAKLMFQYYKNTNEKYKPFNAFYLNDKFFRLIFNNCRQYLLLAAAFEPNEKEPIALSLFLEKGERLWGRYWGCKKFIGNLHFCLCYYQPIRYAIAKGLKYFDPGIGTDHKIRRGFFSQLAYSLHHFFDPNLALLFLLNVSKINENTRQLIKKQNQLIPWVKNFNNFNLNKL